MLNPSTQSINSLLNGLIPCEGPKAISYPLDFTATASYLFDFTQEYQQKVFTTLQTLMADNGINGSELIVTMNGTGQTLTIPPNSSAIVPIITSTPPVITLSSSGLVTPIPVSFLNFYLPPTVWKTV
ncbi:MAG: DUF1859 domain-containing protein [Patescibacteria group bacterium]|nr:DUF1859 domain-containing protein [Patescibacteria group bacterium]